MDISGVAIPAVPEVNVEPPREAQVYNAVKEAPESEPQKNDAQANTGGHRDPSSNLGRHIDEHA